MSKTIDLKLTEEEVEMLIDALEVDQDGYVEAAKEARGNNNRERRSELEQLSPPYSRTL